MKHRTDRFLCFILLLSLFLIASIAHASEIPGSKSEDPSLELSMNSSDNNRSITPAVTDYGRLSWSIDALGFNSSSPGLIQVEKPSGATCRSAHLFAATTGGTSYQLTAVDVTLDGTAVTWDKEVMSKILSYNYCTDVTSIAKAKIDAAPAGIIDFSIQERNAIKENIDGIIMAVIFDDPNVDENQEITISFLFGAQGVAGDQFDIGLPQPLVITDELEVYMSLGISFSFQKPTAPQQVSYIDVNYQRLTSSAGGQDDGSLEDGALVTVGGVGDSTANPPDPNGAPTNYDYDDELYDLKPYLKNGITSIKVNTIAQTKDDNIFFAGLYFSIPVTVEEGAVLAPSMKHRMIGSEHTVTATLQDENGKPLQGRKVDFIVKTGPHAGKTGNDLTDSRGEAVFTYTGVNPGVDSIGAEFVNSQGQVQAAIPDVKVEWSQAALDADTYYLPRREGTINFTLCAGREQQNRDYILLGSATGMGPTPLPGGQASIPLTMDYFTDVVYLMMNTPVFFDFMASLDNDGYGAAQLNIEDTYPLSQGCVGINLYFAYALMRPFDRVSNAVTILIIE
jgi:hypothetical protein